MTVMLMGGFGHCSHQAIGAGTEKQHVPRRAISRPSAAAVSRKTGSTEELEPPKIQMVLGMFPNLSLWFFVYYTIETEMIEFSSS